MFKIKPFCLDNRFIHLYTQVHDDCDDNDEYMKGNSLIYCSCCHGKGRMNWGLNVPRLKAPNSWWWIKFWNKRYIRWTNPWMWYLPKWKKIRAQMEAEDKAYREANGL